MKPARRKIDRKAINVIHQILHIALRTPSEVADVFTNWSPHVNNFYVTIHQKGWSALTPEATRSTQSGLALSDLIALRDQLIADLAAIQADKPLLALRNPKIDDTIPF